MSGTRPSGRLLRYLGLGAGALILVAVGLIAVSNTARSKQIDLVSPQNPVAPTPASTRKVESSARTELATFALG